MSSLVNLLILAYVQFSEFYTTSQLCKEILFLGIGYLSIGDGFFQVCLKSSQMCTDFLSAFMVGTIGIT